MSVKDKKSEQQWRRHLAGLSAREVREVDLTARYLVSGEWSPLPKEEDSK